MKCPISLSMNIKIFVGTDLFLGNERIVDRESSYSVSILYELNFRGQSLNLNVSFKKMYFRIYHKLSMHHVIFECSIHVPVFVKYSSLPMKHVVSKCALVYQSFPVVYLAVSFKKSILKDSFVHYLLFRIHLCISLEIEIEI